MAIDYIPHRERHDLARSQKRFYPVKIPVSHWQLRHYISSPTDDIIYYASGADIYRLDTLRKKRKHIARLTFEARCTASGYGWICVAGEDDGHFAAIKIDGIGAWDVDAPLPLNQWRQLPPRAAASIRCERIGEEIVNSISLHRLRDEEAHLDDTVAVLTNNDRTVRIYSLPLGEETCVLSLPFPMNHATISPDGRTLVAVGDESEAFIYTRNILKPPPQIPKPHNRLNSVDVDWELTSVVALHVASESATKGYFTTAWSPSGRLVAVGSESGYITVIDTDLLADSEVDTSSAVLCIVPGSRAEGTPAHAGAIRSMLFSPDPWDLLIWAEDQGRICIGDLRTSLRDRQIVHLDPSDKTLTTLVVEDDLTDRSEPIVPTEEVGNTSLPEPRLRWTHMPQPTYTSELIESRRRQRQRHSMTTSLSDAPPSLSTTAHAGLTELEHNILQSIRSSRQRLQERSHEVALPDEQTTQSSTSTVDRTLSTFSDVLDTVADSFPELSRTTHAPSPRPPSANGMDNVDSSPLPLHAMPEGVWRSFNRNPYLSSDPTLRPMRRPSVVLALPSGLATDNRTEPSAAEHDASEEERSWRTVEAALFANRAMAASPQPIDRWSSSRPASLAATVTTATPSELPAEPDSATSNSGDSIGWPNARARTTRVMRTFAAQAAATTEAERRYNNLVEARRLAALPGAGAAPEAAATHEAAARRRLQLRGIVGVRTAGLALSADGRTLWAACEDGIFEVDVSVKQRLIWPAVDPR